MNLFHRPDPRALRQLEQPVLAVRVVIFMVALAAMAGFIAVELWS